MDSASGFIGRYCIWWCLFLRWPAYHLCRALVYMKLQLVTTFTSLAFSLDTPIFSINTLINPTTLTPLIQGRLPTCDALSPPT